MLEINYFNKKGKYEVKVMDIMDYGNIIGNISKKVFEQNFKHRSSLVFTTLYKIFDRKSTTVGYKSATRALFHNKKLKVKGKKLKEKNVKVETGIFGAYMQVELINDGPITIMLEK